MMDIERLLEIMARLRDPKTGCPWDKAQSFGSIVPYTIEEAYEVADAIERGAMEDLREELGDLLFQVVFYAQIAHEAGLFEFTDIVKTIIDKLVRRHPHVFGNEHIESAQAQSEAWEQHKEKERKSKARSQLQHPSLLDGIPVTLPALSRAVKLHRRAATVGFDWEKIHDVMDKVHEEVDEIHHEIKAGSDQERMTDEIGDLLFVTTILARHASIDPELALRYANAKFERRFRRVEKILSEQGRSLDEATLDEMDYVWDQVKEEERSGK